MRITGFVFDLDGVITDTAKYHYQAWKETAKAKLNIEISPAVNELLKGQSRQDSLAAIVRFGHQEGRRSAAELAAIATVKNQRYQALIAHMTQADILPGMAGLLNDLANKGYPLAVASASYNAPVIIARLGLSNLLANVVDPGAVARGKPAPDIFEAAAAMIKSPCATTVGFEDAAAGIAGINAAGMFSVGIGSAVTLHEADVVFPATGDADLATIERLFVAKAARRSAPQQAID